MMGRPMATSQDFVNWVCGPAVIPRYLLYIFVAEQESVKRFAHGTTHQTLYYPEAKALSVCLPSRAQQAEIVEVLGALDDKIELARRLARTLYDLALTIGVEIVRSADGQQVSLSEVAHVAKGVSYRSEDLVAGLGWLVGLKCVGRDGTFRHRGLKPYSGPAKPSQVVTAGEILVAQTDLTQKAEVIGRPVRLPLLRAQGTLVASLDFTIVRPKRDLTREILLAVLATQEFREHALSYCNGTTVLHMNSSAVPSFEFRLPRREDADAATARMIPLLQRSDGAIAESLILAEVRDAILPGLLSGRLRVADVVSVTEAVT